MSRRRRAEKREILPDPKFKDLVLSKFMNNLMFDGKKSVSEKIVYGAFDEIENMFMNYDNAMTQIEIRKATSSLRKIWSIGNEYLQRSQPWAVIKTNEAEAAKIIRFGFNLLLFFSNISEPFIPETSYKIQNCFIKSYKEDQWPSVKQNFASIFEKVEIGVKIRPIENLFKKIDDSYVLDLEKQFEGKSN